MNRFLFHQIFPFILLLLFLLQTSQQQNPSIKLSTLVPNGDNVFVNGHYWPAIFSSTWRGATSERNAFYSDFLREGQSWTTALCKLDSDGDGFTNGEELGDPDCVWAAGTTPRRLTDISHPGIWSSIPSDSFIGRDGMAAPQKGCSAPAVRPSPAFERNALRTEVEIPRGLKTIKRTSMLVEVLQPEPYKFTQSGLGGKCPWDQQNVQFWHSGSTWPTGVVPVGGSDVTLPVGKKIVVYACSLPHMGYGRIIVPSGSELILADDNIHLKIKDLIVEGTLWVGSPECPIASPLTLTFIGKKSELDSYSNGIMVTNAGRAEFFGTLSERTWTRLKATAPAGTSFISLQDPVDWSVHEEILIVTSIWKDELDNQNEVRRIAAIDAKTRSFIKLDKPLNFKHFAGEEYQTEVALLWRSILLRGDKSGAADSFGGHTMAMGNKAVFRMVATRAERMGQLNIMGRYPYHMHMMYEAGATSYFQQLACVHSYFRCYTIHGTNDTLVKGNIAFNVSGNTFYLEDGGEMNNTIEFNLAAYVHTIGRPAAGAVQDGEEFIEEPDVHMPGDHTAAGFYISNPANRLRGNAASGGWTGFAFPRFDTCLMLSAHLTVIPKDQPILEFNGNSAHSSGYFWESGACVYFGGHLWVDENGKLKYSNGRFWHDIVEFHKVTNHRSWMCMMGLFTWGRLMDIRNYECHDCFRTAKMFGEASISNFIFTGESSNKPYDMVDLPRQGFEFYSVNVRTILSNATFRNVWIRNNEGSEKSCILKDITGDDKWKQWGLSAIKNIRFSNVDRELVVRRMFRETSSSRLYNFVDWDSSLVNKEQCSGTIVGSDIDWWNAGDCKFDNLWSEWLCPKKPGREVVGLDMELPGIQRVVEVSTERDGSLPQAQRDKLYIGHMSQFGVEGGKRRLTLTRNRHLASGLSGIGWYMYTTTGLPRSIVINPINFPRGTYILLAMSYPPGTTFNIYSTNKKSQITTFAPLSDRNAVLNSNGSFYHFNQRHLYLKVGDWWTEFNLTYIRDGVEVYEKQEINTIIVEAKCLRRTSEGYCAPSATPDPPEDIGPLPVRICNDMKEFLEPVDVCPGVLDIPPSNFIGTCADFKAQRRCRAPFQFCIRTCNSACTPINPYPYKCSRDIPCNKTEKPKPLRNWCEQMENQPQNDICHLATCDSITGRMKRVKLPPGTPCSRNDRVPVVDGYCTIDGECVASPQNLILPIESESVSIRVRVNSTRPLSKVQAFYNVAHLGDIFTMELFPESESGVFSATSLQGEIARNVTILVSYTDGQTAVRTFPDWNDRSNVNPTASLIDVSNNALSFTISPIDFVGTVYILNSDGSKQQECSVVSSQLSLCPLSSTFSLNEVYSIRLKMRHGMLLTYTLPCLSSTDGSVCTTRTFDIRPPQSQCSYTFLNVGTTSSLLQIKSYQKDTNVAAISSVTALGLGRKGIDLPLVFAWGSYKAGTGVAVSSPATIKVALVDGTEEVYELPFPIPPTDFPIRCVSGNYRDSRSPPQGIAGTCLSKTCVV